MGEHSLKYKRGAVVYECTESKFRQEVTVKGLIKWALPGDWICQMLDEKGNLVGHPFIAQPKDFYTNFTKVDE